MLTSTPTCSENTKIVSKSQSLYIRDLENKYVK